ncbi:thioredoxin domain-containing protein [Saccharopolyspora mangrovi]|uniref:Thioredoxin family protein n=1 Tax=Saccharopolyspora mangrovi TaxID=3082379 RepID=A0ABU6AHC2_9PSEU|nr:hypothetical protein [Saccharopolyspora sp. S2-29]MEB3370961.1 hypothetical protein [Saccharopolyspora sp. S2-29]
MNVNRTEVLVLRIYVSPGCAGCRTAEELADTVRRVRPAQPVELIDLAEHDGPMPEGLVGTPTYRLGKTTIALGNPSLPELLHHLDNHPDRG